MSSSTHFSITAVVNPRDSKTLQQIRDTADRFKSTNVLRSYFAAPVDALLSFLDESGIRAIGTSPDRRSEFWESANVARILRRD